MTYAISKTRREFLLGFSGMIISTLAPMRNASSSNFFEEIPTSAMPIRIEGYKNLLLPEGRFPEKWQNMINRHEAQEYAAKAAPDSQCRWHRLVTEYSGCPLNEGVLWDIQRAVNRIKWISDELNHGVADWWATPREFLSKGGDCEDFAVAKYLLLRRLGMQSNGLALVVCRNFRNNTTHAVTTCYISKKMYILDNLILQPLEGWPHNHYQPLYFVNEQFWAVFSADPVAPRLINATTSTSPIH